MDFKQTFISYARSDGRYFARDLRQKLAALDISLWQDVVSEIPGEGWWLNIIEALERSSTMIMVFTERALDSQVTKDEWLYARKVGTPIIPVIPDARMFQENVLDGTPLVPAWLSRLDILILDEANCDYDEHWGRLLQTIRNPPPRRPVPFDAPRLPEEFVSRPTQEKQILSRLVASDGFSPRPGRTALVGEPGFGKSTLAQAVCWHPEVIEAFKDGILWFELGEHATETTILQRMNEAIMPLGFSHAQSIEEAKQHLIKWMSDRDCLLVIDGVWEPGLLEPFLFTPTDTERPYRGTRAWLFTAREPGNVSEYLDERAGLTWVNEMSNGEATALLSNYVPSELKPLASEDMAPLSQLATELGEWPLLLNIVGEELHLRMLEGASLPDTLMYITAGLQEEGFEAFDLPHVGTSPSLRHHNLDASLSLSLRRFETGQQLRLFELTIFPENTDIPASIASKLWNQTGNIGHFAAERLLGRFNGPFLRLDLNSRIFRFHSVLRQYLKNRLDQLASEVWAETHAALLAAYNPLEERWQEIVLDDYLISNLTYHLREAKRFNDLKSLFASPEWRQIRFRYGQYTYDGFAEDLMIAWGVADQCARQEIENDEEPTKFSDCLRYALIRTSLNSFADNYSPQIVVSALDRGVWTAELAISITRRVSDQIQRAEMCAVLLNEAALSREDVLKLHRVFFDTVGDYPNSSFLVDALKKLGPALDPSYLHESIALIQKIVFLEQRAEGIGVLLPHMDQSQKQMYLLEILDLILVEEDARQKERALANIAPHLTKDVTETVISILQKVRGGYEFSSTVSAISPLLTEEQIRTLFQITTHIRDGKERAQAISALANRLPEDLIESARAVVENVDEIHARIEALVDLSTRMEDTQKQPVLSNVFQDIRSSQNTVTRSDFPTRWLYNRLPDEYQIEAIKCSYETGLLVTSAWHRAEAFGLVVFRLCERKSVTDLEDMFESSFHNLLHLAVVTCDAITQLVPHLSEPYLDMAIQTVVQVLALPLDDDKISARQGDYRDRQQKIKERVIWTARILPYLDNANRAVAFNKGLDWAFLLAKPKDLFDALDRLVVVLDSGELKTVLFRLSEIRGYTSQVGAMSRLAQQLSEREQVEVIERILYTYWPRILTESEKAYTIARISPLLQNEHLQFCMEELMRFKEERAISIALANIGVSVKAAPIEEIYRIISNISADESRSLVIEAVADKLTPPQISECLEFVLSLSNTERKCKILTSFAPKLNAEQLQSCYGQIQSGNEKLINIVVAASLLTVFELADKERFLADSFDTILSIQPNQSQFGIVWAVSSIAPHLNSEQKATLLAHALLAATSMPGNMSSYPGGNPKVNAFKKLIPYLDTEMQKTALDEVKNLPHLAVFANEEGHPVAQILEATGLSLSPNLFSVALDMLEEVDDGWAKTHALEILSKNISGALFDQYLRVTRQLPSAWMRARALVALSDKDRNNQRIIRLVWHALLDHLLEMQEKTRDELLWSIDIHLFKKPYMISEILLAISHDITEICDVWIWNWNIFHQT